jgi:hypothetical protein
LDVLPKRRSAVSAKMDAKVGSPWGKKEGQGKRKDGDPNVISSGQRGVIRDAAGSSGAFCPLGIMLSSTLKTTVEDESDLDTT